MAESNDIKQSPNESQSAAAIFAGYNGGEQMPLQGYAALLGIFNAGFAAMLLAAANNSKNNAPEKFSYQDLILLGAATHKLSRIVAKDRVTAPLRAPFVEYIEPAGQSEVKERVRGRGMQRAIGDLVTCPWCLNPWIAASLTFAFVFKPRTTRIVAGVFAAVTIADFLHAAAERAKPKD